MYKPEQTAAQEQTRQLDAQRKSLVGRAKQVFATEMEWEEAGGCAGAKTTGDFNNRFSKAEELPDESLKGYEAAIRGVLGLKHPAWPGVETTPSASESVQTPE